MKFKNFRTNLIIRIIILAGTIFLFFYSFRIHVITPILVFLGIIYQISDIIRYVDKTNRELTGFLESIRFSEFTRTFQMEGMGSSFDELNTAFNDVIHDFQKVRSEKEEHFHYLQTIVQNIDVSVIAYSLDGTVELINKAAKKLFQVSGLKNINGLEKISNELVQVLFRIKPGQNELVKVHDEEDFLQLAIHATNIKIKDKIIILVTIKDIQHVLEEQETESWQKLIRVLTHEIMNSITPIASLSATLENMLTTDNKVNHSLDNESIHELQEALITINRRSTGLLHFVNTYRNLTKIPKPNFEKCKMSEMFANVKNLLKEEIKTNKIKLNLKIEPEDIDFTIDERLIEQVLINLIKNSIHALKGGKNAQIKVFGFYNKRGRVSIQVTDNGPGILPDVIDKIFIPFFTTKT